MDALQFSNAMQLALYGAAPLVLAVLCAGIFAGVLQTITQISDDAISFSVRVLAAVVAIWFFGGFVFSEFQTFSTAAWTIPQTQ